MGIGDILNGHLNELLGTNKDFSEVRMSICRQCPLFLNITGGICNSRLWLNTETGDVSMQPKDDYKNGCGCRLQAKTTLTKANCPVGKW